MGGFAVPAGSGLGLAGGRGECGDRVGDGLGGAVGDDGTDGDLVIILVPDAPDVECIQHSLDQARGCLVQEAGELGQVV
jgi:hypothetical protein